MLQKLKNKLILIIGAAILLSPALVPNVASANSLDISGNICNGTNASNSGASCSTSGSASSAFNKIITTIINIFSLVVGGVSVLMIIVGGFRYIISGGNDTNISGAKNTIIYALIGLVIVALSQLIVHFVLTKIAPING